MAKSPQAFRTISEAASDLDLPQHVLRFWETRFSQIKPMKRAGGRRYYRPEDIDLLGGIKLLLYDRGYTIKGVQKMLKERGIRHVSSLTHEQPTTEEPADVPNVILGEPAGTNAPAARNGTLDEGDRAVLNEVLLELLECKRTLDRVA